MQKVLQSEGNLNGDRVKEIEASIKSMIAWMSAIKKGDE
jgi:hypothetical protein